MDGEDKLDFGWSLSSEPMLIICKDVVSLEAFHDMTMYYMFKDLTAISDDNF